MVIRWRIVLSPAGYCRNESEMDDGAYGARHSMPSQCHMTSPRQYIGPAGPALWSGNSARKAISEEFASVAMPPGENRSEKPVLAARRSPTRDRKPALIRGNKRNNKTTTGAA